MTLSASADTSVLQSAAAPTPEAAAPTATPPASVPADPRPGPTQPLPTTPSTIPTASAAHPAPQLVLGAQPPQQTASPQTRSVAPAWHPGAPHNGALPGQCQHGWCPGNTSVHGYGYQPPAQAPQGGHPGEPGQGWRHSAQYAQQANSYAPLGHSAVGVYQGHSPHSIAQQAYFPQGVTPQHAPSGHVPAGYQHRPAGQWTPGQQAGVPSHHGGWHSSLYTTPQRHSGSQPQSHIGYNWAVWPSGPANMAPGGSPTGGSVQTWRPLQDNTAAMHVQQQQANVHGPTQWQYQGHPGVGSHVPPSPGISHAAAAQHPGAKPIDDMFSGMHIRQ